MKSRSYSPSFSPLSPCALRRQKNLLLGMGLFLIFCWTLGAIWLIGVRRGERSTAEVLAQQRTIAVRFQGEMVGSRQPGAGNFALFLVKAE